METPLTPALPATRQKRVRWQFYLAGLLAVIFLIYFFQPGFSSWWLRRHLVNRARDAGLKASFGKVEADYFAGSATLHSVQLNDGSHPENTARCEEITADFSPWRLLFSSERSPIRKIAFAKTQLDWRWRSEKSFKQSAKTVRTFRNRFPEALTGSGISANLECGVARLEFANSDFTFQPNAAGEINIPRLNASLPPWKRTFNNLEGVTAIKERALYVGGLKFTPDLILERGSLDFTLPDKRKITSDLLFSAFGGQWRTDLTLDRRKAPLEIDTASSFWNLSVKQLGEFVGNEKLAEGLIHEGRLTFHGNPSQLDKANTTLRLNATDFRWHERRWDSLIASALLVNRRIEIAQFDLVQEKNQIQLKGNANLPAKWTQAAGDFQFQVLAQLDDLHSAALLVLPSQKGISGEAFFAGEVRSQKGKFSGNLKMRGGPLEISGVSVDRVRGDLDLQGSEISATSLELARHDDKAAGWATLDLSESRRYSGEFEVTAVNIADYAAILPRAVADRATAGGVKLWWSGDGISHAHSGAFKLGLRDFLISREASAVPLGVESDGSYSPAGITLNHLTLRRPNTTLEAAIAVRPETTELRDLKVTGSGGSSMTGHLTLPINLLAALNTPTLAALLDSKASAGGQITASKIRLDELCELVGRHFPFRGRANLTLAVEGPLEDPTIKFEMAMTDFFARENWSIPAMKAAAGLTNNQLSLSSDINPDEGRDSVSFDLAAMTALSKAGLSKGKWLDEGKPISGNIKANRLALSFLHRWWPQTRPFQGDAGGALTFGGTWASPFFEGQIALQNTEWQPAWLAYPLQKLNGTLQVQKDQLTSEKVIGNYRNGSFSVSGSAGFLPSQKLDLTISGKKLTLAAPGDSSEAVVDGSLHLTGPSEDRTLGGLIILKSAVFHRELTVLTPAMALPAVSRFTVPWVPQNWKVDLEVTAEQPIEIRGKANSWMVQPEMVFRNTASNPLILGKLQIQALGLNREPAAEDHFLAYFMDSILEEGVVEDTQPAVMADLPPAPSVEAIDAPVPAPTPKEAPRRIEILPLDKL